MKTAIKRPVATIMITLMVLVIGVYSIIGIPRNLMPDFEMPMAIVMTTYGGASPSEIETMVTEPIEQALASVEGMEEMVSYSMENMSIVMIRFSTKTDMDFAALHMSEAVSLIDDYLPDNASKPTVMKMNMDMMPVMQVYVSGDMELSKLNAAVENDILPYFERCSGVASTSVLGGVSDEISIKFDQQSLNAYGLSLATLSSILSAENINLPSGDVSRGNEKVIVRTVGKFQTLEDIRNLPVTVADRSIVRLGDIASVTQGYSEQEDLTRMDQKTAIGIMISKQSDANTVETCADLQDVLTQLREDFPEINFTVGYDSADYVNNSIASVARSAIEGALLAVLVVFLFLGNIGSTLVIAISIPTSLLATFAFMKYSGITLNLITLCSLTLVVGMLVDNSIVVLENIFRIRQDSASSEEAAIKGSREVFVAILASTLTTIVVFLPIALSGGMASMIFKDFCFTIIIALIASLIVALSVVPMFSSLLMKRKVSNRYLRIGKRRYKYKLIPRWMKFIEELKETYRIYVTKVLAHRRKFIIACVGGFIVSILLVVVVGWELLPEMDEGEISVSVSTPYGTSLEDKDAIITGIEEYISGLPEVEHLAVTTGSMSMFSSSNGATISVDLVKMNERDRSTAEVASDIKHATSDIAGADISVSASQSIASMMSSNDISINLMGKDNEELERIGNELVEQINELKEIDYAELNVTDGNPEIKVKIDRNAAANFGITAYQLSSALSNALDGTSATDVKINGDDIKVKLSLTDSYADSVENMKQIMVTGSYGISVPVEQVATFEYGNSPTQINHYNQVNYVVINAEIIGNDLNKVTEKVMDVVNDYEFPEGYYVMEDGSYEQMMEIFGDLLLALVVSILLVFLILAAQFESITKPFIVVMAIPFAMSGAFLAMFLTNTSLSMTSFLGLIILVGTVVNNSILLVEFINQNKQSMGRNEALVQAGMMRLRPIMMSCGTTVIGMIPLSLGLGEGGEMLAPIGIAIIGGLVASTLVTLFLVPVIYAILDEGEEKRANKRRAKAIQIAELEEQWAKEDEALDSSGN